jgi:hypothetical protein
MVAASNPRPRKKLEKAGVRAWALGNKRENQND